MEVIRGDGNSSLVSTTGTMAPASADARRQADDLIMLKRAVEAAREAVFVTDREDVFTYVNPEFTRLYGYALEEVIGKLTPKILDSGQHKQEEFDQVWTNIKAGQTVEGEFATKARDGRLLIVESTSRPVVDEAGRFVGHLSVHRDITRRRLERQRLEESERRFRLIAENTADFICTITLGGVFTWVSPSYSRLGFTLDELVGKPVATWVEPGDAAQLAAQLGRGGGAPGVELEKVKLVATDRLTFRFADKSGNWHYMEASVNPVESSEGGGVSLLVVSRDVTGRTWAQRELKAQKELVERAISSTPHTVLVVGQDGRMVLANEAFYRMFPETRDKVEGNAVAEVAGLANLAPAIGDVLAGQASLRRVDYKYNANGLQLDYTASIVSTQKGEAQVIIADVTEEREKQVRLYSTHRLASVGQMAAGAAHELNNPLTSIIGLSQLLMQEQLSSQIRDDIESIHREAQRAASIIRNLLTFARKQPLVKQPEQVNSIIEGVLRLRAYEHNSSHIEVETHLDPALPRTLVDQFQMQQVFLNIVLNGEDAMLKAHDGGRLTVATAPVDGRVRITFTDDGEGIAAEHMPYIFDPFFSTKGVGKGTGLGLSIAHGVITDHGGRIWAESTRGHGATFIIELPVTEGAEAGVTPPAGDDKASGQATRREA